MKTLFDISDDLLALEDTLDALSDDATPEQIAELIDAALATSGELETKLDNYAALIRQTEARAEARRTEIARLTSLVVADSNRTARLKERLKYFFDSRRISKFETARYKFAIANNGGKLPLEIDGDPELLPEPYRRIRVTITPDQDAIRAALETGEQLDFARFGERGTNLRIK